MKKTFKQLTWSDFQTPVLFYYIGGESNILRGAICTPDGSVQIFDVDDSRANADFFKNEKPAKLPNWYMFMHIMLLSKCELLHIEPLV